MPLYYKREKYQIPLVLDVDEGDENPVTFNVKPITIEEQIELSNAYDGLHDADQVKGLTNEAFFDRAVALLEQVLVSVDNAPADFTLKKLQYQEVRELVRKVIWSSSLKPVEKKD